MEPTFKLEVDWNDNGTWTDESRYVRRIRWRAGFERPYEPVAAPGRCTLWFDNTDRRFSPGNAASPLASKLLPGRALRVTVTVAGETSTVFTGFLERIEPTVGAQGGECVLSATDGLSILAHTRPSLPHVDEQAVADTVQTLVNAAYTPPLWQIADNGDRLTHIGRHWLPERTTAREALADVCRAAYGRLWLGRDGTVHYWSRREQQVLPVTPALVVGDYRERVLSVCPSRLVAYWPLNETQGVTASDHSRHGFDGTVTGVTWGQPGIGDGGTVPYFDGVNDVIDLYGAGLATAFDGDEGTFLLWIKPESAALWGDGVTRYLLNIRVGSDNRIACNVAGSGYLYVTRVAGGASLNRATLMTGAGAGWHCIAATWSRAADALRLFVDGVPVGSPVTGLGAFAGIPTLAVAGAAYAVSNVWLGCVGHVALWNVALDDDAIAMLGRV